MRPLSGDALREAFSYFDKDGGGRVSLIQLEAGLQTLGFPGLDAAQVCRALLALLPSMALPNTTALPSSASQPSPPPPSQPQTRPCATAALSRPPSVTLLPTLLPILPTAPHPTYRSAGHFFWRAVAR